ncbi:hypothetical protein BDR04DRAFT_1096534 [Suillus decipiens]|nr:hypothetical protein BDR04DRAFT_1096534 [Suillus decipiens]
MRLSLFLAVVTAFKLTVSAPAPVTESNQCPFYCDKVDCCFSYECQLSETGPWTVSMSGFNRNTHGGLISVIGRSSVCVTTNRTESF